MPGKVEEDFFIFVGKRNGEAQLAVGAEIVGTVPLYAAASLNELAKNAAMSIQRAYAPEAERESIVNCWNAILR